MVHQKDACCSRFKIVLKKLVESKRLSMHDCDHLSSKYSEFVDKASKFEKSEFEDFDFKVDRLDEFLFKHVGKVTAFSKLWNLMKKLLILSHGQASVERGFSVNRQVMVENMKEHSFIAQRSIHDHVQSIGGLAKLDVSKDLLLAAKAGRKKYLEYLDKQKQEHRNEVRQNKRKKVEEEKDELVKKKIRLSKDITALQHDADMFAAKAEEKAELVLLSKSNALRKSAKEKECVLATVEKNLIELTEKISHLN